jgi:hypothetical protein
MCAVAEEERMYQLGECLCIVGRVRVAFEGGGEVVRDKMNICERWD